MIRRYLDDHRDDPSPDVQAMITDLDTILSDPIAEKMYGRIEAPFGDEEPDREPTVMQEEAWNVREEVARGGEDPAAAWLV